ncbi:hypothetical protein ACFYTC_18730 [Actinomadura nitritigenes]|uniref:hypothetical protein n=1 Tax=Actinomadura nitritigenes TaxID=134602 RepID=UPI0036B80AF7
MCNSALTVQSLYGFQRLGRSYADTLRELHAHENTLTALPAEPIAADTRDAVSRAGSRRGNHTHGGRASLAAAGGPPRVRRGAVMDRRTLDVFISHAVEHGTRGEKFLFGLSNDLAGKGHRVFINQDIPVGTPGIRQS